MVHVQYILEAVTANISAALHVTDPSQPIKTRDSFLKLLSSPVILKTENAMVTKVMGELKPSSRLKRFPEDGLIPSLK